MLFWFLEFGDKCEIGAFFFFFLNESIFASFPLIVPLCVSRMLGHFALKVVPV